MANLATKLKKLTGMKGIHYFVTRFGPTSLRKMGFDQKYLTGQWKNFHEKPDVELAGVIEKYSNNGHILALGCGVATVTSVLKPEVFASFHGVDLSDAAIALAKQNESDKISFQVDNMLDYSCSKKIHVILLSESIYYIPKGQMGKQLKHLQNYLTPDGVILVTIAEPKRYQWILELIRCKYNIIEDKKFQGSKRHLLIFR